MFNWINKLFQQGAYERREPPKKTGIREDVATGVGMYIAADILSSEFTPTLDKAAFIATPFVAGIASKIGAEHGAQEHQSNGSSPSYS